MCHTYLFVLAAKRCGVRRIWGIGMLSGLLTALLIIVAFVLIVLIIALQHGNEGGIGSAFGSGNSAGFFGASGGVSLIIRATWICGALFFGLSTALAWVKTHDHFGVSREIDTILGADPTPGPNAQGTAPAAASPTQGPAGLLPDAGTDPNARPQDNLAPAATVPPAQGSPAAP